MAKRPQLKWGVAAAVALLAIVALAAYTWGRPLTVTVAPVEKDVPIQVFGLGTVEAQTVSKIGFETAGTLVELHADHGDSVKAGTLLGRLQSREQEARVAQARAAVVQAQAGIEQAESSIEKADVLLKQKSETNQRRQELVQRGVVSRENAGDTQAAADVAEADLSQARSSVSVARANLEQAKAVLILEEARLAKYSLYAPFDGVVMTRYRELGSALNANEAVFQLVDPATIWALAYIDEARAGPIEVGQTAEVIRRSAPNLHMKARVARIDIESDRVNEERRVYVRCRGCPLTFHLGEQAEVLITVGRLAQARLLKLTSLLKVQAAGDRLDRRGRQAAAAAGNAWAAHNRRPCRDCGRRARRGAARDRADNRPRDRSPRRRRTEREAGRREEEMNLAWRDIRHKLGRFVLTCLGLSLLLGVVITMAGIYRGQTGDALALARAINADLWIVEAGTSGPFAEASRIPGDTREIVARINGVVEAGSITFQNVQIVRGGRRLRLQVVGYEPGRPGGPVRLIDGRDITRSHYELIADRQTGFAVGDTVHLVYMALRDAQQLQFDLAPPAARREAARGAARAQTDLVNAVVARLGPDVLTDEVAEVIRRWKHLSVLTEKDQEQLLTLTVIERARRQLGLFMGILTIVSAVIIALIIYTLTMDKVREIATLKLIGAPDRTIIGLILQQALLLGIVGFIAGTTLVYLFNGWFPRRIEMLPEDIATLFGVVVVVCLLASMLGVRAALRIDAARALTG